MKALSLKQPYAGLIAGGFKTIETRKWKTNYRGDLLICSSQKPMLHMDHQIWYKDPLCYYVGSTICLVKLVDCVPMEKYHEKDAMCAVYHNAWAWILNDIRPVKTIPVTGQLSIFDVDFSYDDLKP